MTLHRMMRSRMKRRSKSAVGWVTSGALRCTETRLRLHQREFSFPVHIIRFWVAPSLSVSGRYLSHLCIIITTLYEIVKAMSPRNCADINRVCSKSPRERGKNCYVYTINVDILDVHQMRLRSFPSILRACCAPDCCCCCCCCCCCGCTGSCAGYAGDTGRGAGI